MALHPIGHGGTFSETPPFSWTKSVQWLGTGLLGGGTGYQSATTYDLAKFNLITGATEALVAGIGKGSLGYGNIAACCIDYAGNIVVGERIVDPSPSGFGETGWTAGRLLHKYTSSGQRIFSTISPASGTFEGTQRIPSGVAVDSLNNIYLSENYHGSRAFLRKFTPLGAQIWEKDLGEGFTAGVMGVPGGGCVVAFSVSGSSTLRRYDADGVAVWSISAPGGAFMSGGTGRRVISQKPSNDYVAVCAGSWFTETPSTTLISVASGAVLWTHDHGEDANHACDIGGSGDNEAVFVSVIKAGEGDSFSMNIEKLSIASGAVLDQVQTGSADLSPNTGYPIACSGDVVASMVHDHTEFDIPFVDRWDEYNFNVVCHSQSSLNLRWQKFWGRLSGFMDNAEGPFGELNEFGRAPG